MNVRHEPPALYGRADLGGFAIAAGLIAGGAAIAAIEGARDPVTLLMWLSVWALPAGVLAGGLDLSLWPLGLCVPGGFTLTVTLVDAASDRDLPTPLYASLVLTGLFLAGWALGRRARGGVLRAAGIGLALAALSFAAPLTGLVVDPPASTRVRAVLLDLSVGTLVVESSGVDWLRHPTVYRAAGAADLDPSTRRPYRGFLAGLATLLVGCGLALLSRLGGPRSLRSAPRESRDG